MPKARRAAHATVPIPKGEEAKARTFYGQALGLREIPKPAALAARGGVWFDLDGFQVHATVEERPASLPMGGAGVRLAFEVDDVEAMRKDLTRRQVNVQDAPPIPGARRFHALDPWGNRLEFIQKAA